MGFERPDFVIVGAGSAGCVLANRLTENGRWSVMLLEAGPPGHPLASVPLSFGLFIDDPAVNWRYSSEPEAGTANRAIPVPRGRLVGGSSMINGMVFVRGQPLDFDSWAQMGNRGWSYDDVLPLFQRMETFERETSAHRGRHGPLRVSEVSDENPIYDALFAAAEELGIKRNPDYNDIDQEGVCKTQVTISKGVRMSAARCYLRPARKRQNLRIRSDAMVESLLIEDGACVGATYRWGGKRHEVRAAKEVILCAGGVASPQILELSGIGRPDVLKAQGIDVRHPLPAVGENLRDHINARIQWRIKTPGASYNERMRGIGKLRQALRYAATRGGFLSLPSAPLLAFLKTKPDLDTPDVQFHLVPYAVKNPKKRQLQDWPGMTTACYQLRPESLGSIHIRSPEPDAQPAIRFNFLADSIDQAAMVGGFRLMRRLGNARALDDLRDGVVSPGASVERDDEILDWIRGNSETAYHPVGTCRMGPVDRASVVDDRLRVHGLRNLRVADASIMPTMVSGNTNAAALMIGEKASDLVREDWSP